MKVTVLKGLPGSGKSSYAQTLQELGPDVYKIINKDLLRVMLDNGKYTYDNEHFVVKVRNDIILLALNEGYHPIIDDCNLNPLHITAIEELARGMGASVEIVDFTAVPLEECLKRNRERKDKKPIPEQEIVDMHNKYLAKEQSKL
jgi:predicted kinase